LRFIEHTNGYFVPVHRKADIGNLVHFLENAKYLAKTKTWNIPKTELNRLVLQKRGFVQQIKRLEIKPIPSSILKTLPSNLYDVQLTALEFLYNRGGSALISYAPGMGKTAIGLVYTLIEEIGLTVIVCQATLKTQWEKQIELWLGKRSVHIVYGQTPQPLPDKGFIILNYEILQYHSKALSKLHPDLFIIDEVQFFKNNKAQRTKAMYETAFLSNRIIGLSGTPIDRRLYEFYPILHVLRADVFDTFFHFASKYCNAHIGRNGWEYDGTSNEGEFQEHLSSLMIRKNKRDSHNMPDRVIIPMFFKMGNEAEYFEEEERMIEVFGEGNYLANQKSIVYMQYLAFLSKREDMLKWIADFIADGTKLIVFAEHRKIVESIHEHFKTNSVKYYGGMSNVLKQEAKDKFLNDVPLFVANTKSGGTGLDGLQHVCHNVCVAELGWTSTGFDQAVGRVERIGQKNDINVYVALTQNSIEEHIMQVIDKSRLITTLVLDGVKAESVDLLKELVKIYNRT